MKREGRSFRPDVLFGIICGLAMAALTSLVALAIFVLQGPGAFERLGVSLWEAIALYLLAGVVGGAIFGLLRPVANTRGGSIFVGILVAVPAFAGVGILVDDFHVLRALGNAALVGGIVGYGLWSARGEHRQT